MKSPVLTPRSELACALTILLVGVLFCCAAPFLLAVQILRWLRRQAILTARECWADRHEMAAYLFVLAVLAFLIFIYTYDATHR